MLKNTISVGQHTDNSDCMVAFIIVIIHLHRKLVSIASGNYYF